MRCLPEQQRLERMADIAWAMRHRCGFKDLSELWGVTNVAAWNWCQNHCSEADCEKLAENGRGHAGGSWARGKVVSEDRLALIALTRSQGWTDARLARAMGITQQAICNWLRTYAPDGIEDALSDFDDSDIEIPSREAGRSALNAPSPGTGRPDRGDEIENEKAA